MKTITTFLTICIFSMISYGQGLKMSVEATRLLNEAEKLNFNLSDKSSFTTDFIEKHRIYSIKNKAYVGGLLKVNNSLDQEKLDELKVISRTKAGNIWTVSIPIDQIEALAELNGVDYVQVANKTYSKLYEALYDTNVDYVHEGYNISSAFMGEDVVVGVVDFGFDYTHPAFYDTSGSYNRIVRAWNNSGNANPPSGFQFGSEFSNSSAILAEMSDGMNESHGTHVAGIAAGAGYGDSDWNGVAPMSDIIMVSGDIPSNGVDNVIDAIDYIFNYATNEGKPAVVNLSLGTHMGPHDGTSLFDQALNNLIGPGKIVVGAAGNEGSTALHLSGDLSNTDTAITIIGNAGYQDDELVDIWGESGQQFKVMFFLWDTAFVEIDQQTAFISSASNSNQSLEMVDFYGDTCWVDVSTNSSEFNGRPHIAFSHYNESEYLLSVAITAVSSTSSTIHMWNHADGNGAELHSHPTLPGSLDGNTDITIGEIGGTSDSIITVGAYTTKNNYLNLQNNNQVINDNVPLGQIASFSSRGPTVDNRIKPEVTAPGNVVVSAVNSFDSNYGPLEPTVAHSQVHSSKTYYYAALEGTSMATPMITGIIALWLENYNNLSASDIRDIFEATSTEDSFTGNNLPDNTWGHGKVDAYAGLVIVGLDENEKVEEKYTIYPNPAQDRIHILSDNFMKEAQIFSSEGKLIRTIGINSNSKIIDLNGIDNGVYYLRVFKEKGVSTRSLVIAR